MKAGKTKADFYDYEAYVAKFRDRADLPKTTDETYTPEDVYNAVVDYVDTIYPLEGKVVVRPFYPGGDYEHYNYPPNGVVIDNPPFSIIAKIVTFYMERGVPFFLFCCHNTSAWLTRSGATVIYTDLHIRFDNGAKIPIAFVTSLTPRYRAIASPKLRKAIMEAPSQAEHRPKTQKSYTYPPNILLFSQVSVLAKGDEEFYIDKERSLTHSQYYREGKAGFGCNFLVDDLTAGEARRKADEARRKSDEARSIRLTLTEENEEVLAQLNAKAREADKAITSALYHTST